MGVGVGASVDVGVVVGLGVGVGVLVRVWVCEWDIAVCVGVVFIEGVDLRVIWMGDTVMNLDVDVDVGM